MSDTTSTTTGTDSTTTPATGTDALGDAGKRALDAERARGNTAERLARELQAKLDEFEAKGRTDAEKAVARAEKAERELAEAASRLLRAEVAAAKGIPADMAHRLVGATREELEADAAVLAKMITPPTTADPATAPAGTKPTENLKNGGNPGGDVPLNGDPIVDALKAKLGIA